MKQVEKKSTDKPMVLVKAITKGYYDGVLREPDQGENSEFHVPEGATASWFEPVKSSGKKSDDPALI